MPVSINVSDSSHPLPTYATLRTALLGKWAQLGRHELLEDTGVLPSLTRRRPNQWMRSIVLGPCAHMCFESSQCPDANLIGLWTHCLSVLLLQDLRIFVR